MEEILEQQLLFEVELLQHFLQLRKFSGAAKVFAGCIPPRGQQSVEFNNSYLRNSQILKTTDLNSLQTDSVQYPLARNVAV